MMTAENELVQTRRAVLAMTRLIPTCDGCEKIAPTHVAEDMTWFVDATLTPDGPVQTIRCPECW